MSLRVTLLAGPSTSLRDDVVRCLVLRWPGLVAVCYDVLPTAAGPHLLRRIVDAAGTQRERVELTACCIACTVREDAGRALDRLAAVRRRGEAVLALPPSLQPGPLADELRGRHDLHVDTVTTVVDALLVRELLSGDDLLADRGLAAAPTDRRSTSELVVGQLEDADVLAVANLHRVATDTARTLEALLAHLAPLALQVPLGPGGVGADDVVSTGRHDLASTPLDRERLAGLASGLCPPSCGVTTVRWQADRPLHAGRLYDALPDLVADVVRSRGYIWLADRPLHMVRWQSAGGSLSLGDPARWQTTPGCELLLTGIGLNADALIARLDDCLATDEELTGPAYGDPFAGVLGPTEATDR